MVGERVGEVAEQDVGVAALGDDPGELWVEGLEGLEVAVVRLGERVGDGAEILPGSGRDVEREAEEVLSLGDASGASDEGVKRGAELVVGDGGRDGGLGDVVLDGGYLCVCCVGDVVEGGGQFLSRGVVLGERLDGVHADHCQPSESRGRGERRLLDGERRLGSGAFELLEVVDRLVNPGGIPLGDDGEGDGH